MDSHHVAPMALYSHPPDSLPMAMPETTQIAQTRRKIRKRARRACFSCHIRKVRCDVVVTGTACTNCKLDGKECVIRPSAYRWQSHMQRVLEQQQDQFEQAQSESSGKPQDSLQAAVSPANSCQLSESQRPSTTSEHENEGSEKLFDANSFKIPSVITAPSSETSLKTTRDDSSSGFVLFSSCRCIEAADMWRLDPRISVFLEQSGCFHIPARPMLDEFIRQYFLHVHPILPLLNEHQFNNMYSTHGLVESNQKRTPLFLFQAVLFLGCPFVSIATLNSLGFQTVQAARTEFYNRAKLLFDMYPSLDNVTRAQGALMLTYHTSSPTSSEQKQAKTFWLNTAIHYAKSAGAHLYSHLSEDTRDRNVLKRLWWCCILRDRIMALGLRGQLHIKPAEIDVSQEGLVEEDFSDEIRDPAVYDAVTKQALVQLVTLLCELAVALDDILQVLYPEVPVRRDEERPSLAEMRSWSARLDRWYEKASAKFSTATAAPTVNKSLVLYTNMIYIYYNSAKAALCNHMLLHGYSSVENQEDQNESRLQIQMEMNRALCMITDDLVELEHLGLAKFLPNTFIGFSALPFIWHLLGTRVIKAGTPSHGTERISKVYAAIMRGFRHLYESTDEMLLCVERIVDYIKDHEPLQVHSQDWDTLINGSSARDAYPRSGWVDMFLNRPQTFCRIAMTVDFSLTRGHLPSETDFPKALRAFQDEEEVDEETMTYADDSEWWMLFQGAMEVGLGE